MTVSPILCIFLLISLFRKCLIKNIGSKTESTEISEEEKIAKDVENLMEIKETTDNLESL